jgi:Na+/H+-dicarboxylate symporter
MHRIPVAGLVLLLGVERLTNIARAVVNVIGSSVATIVIAKWENAFDNERAKVCFNKTA